MLETPTDENVVRWGNEGDSFVVLEVRNPYSQLALKEQHADVGGRTRNSPNTSFQSTLSTATSLVSFAS
jgi:hypothetical protein